MLFNNVSQFAVLLLLLVVGWLFGFASHPGGKRWKRAYKDEAVGRAQDRDELDAQLRDVDGRFATLTQEKATLEQRNAELTAELEQARAVRPAVAAPVVAAAAAQPAFAATPPPPPPVGEPAPAPTYVAPAAVHADPPPVVARPVEEARWTPAPEAQPAPHPVAEPAAEAQPLPIKRGWFDWSKGDDLTRLRGVDEDLAARLKAEKVESFAELAGLSDQEEIALERRLDLPAGYLMKEQLRDQARLLAEGDSDGHTARFG